MDWTKDVREMLDRRAVELTVELELLEKIRDALHVGTARVAPHIPASKPNGKTVVITKNGHRSPVMEWLSRNPRSSLAEVAAGTGWDKHIISSSLYSFRKRIKRSGQRGNYKYSVKP